MERNVRETCLALRGPCKAPLNLLHLGAHEPKTHFIPWICTVLQMLYKTHNWCFQSISILFMSEMTSIISHFWARTKGIVTFKLAYQEKCHLSIMQMKYNKMSKYFGALGHKWYCITTKTTWLRRTNSMQRSSCPLRLIWRYILWIPGGLPNYEGEM